MAAAAQVRPGPIAAGLLGTCSADRYSLLQHALRRPWPRTPVDEAQRLRLAVAPPALCVHVRGPTGPAKRAVVNKRPRAKVNQKLLPHLQAKATAAAATAAAACCAGAAVVCCARCVALSVVKRQRRRLVAACGQAHEQLHVFRVEAAKPLVALLGARAGGGGSGGRGGERVGERVGRHACRVATDAGLRCGGS